MEEIYSKYTAYWSPYNARGQIARHITKRFDSALDQGRAERDTIRDAAALQARQARIRADFLASVGLEADTYPTALSAAVTGTVQQEGYRTENIVLVPEKGQYITGNLYLPDGADVPRAAVLFLCGHAVEAKLYSEYVEACRRLTSAGLIVFAVDPTGQGERWNYLDPETGQSTVPLCTGDHDRAGCRGLLTGRPLAYYFLRDAMCALSYLAERPEVDEEKIGITGNSGGGTQTSMMMLCDRRLAAAAPGTFIMNMREMQYSGQAQDAEQIWPGFVSNGYDHADILLAMAPKPVLVLAVNYDFFPMEGTQETVKEAARFWEIAGQPGGLQMETDDSFHAYSEKLRCASAAFFAKHLRGEDYDGALLPAPDTAQMLCTKTGQVSTSYPDYYISIAGLYAAYADTLCGTTDTDILRRQVYANGRGAEGALNLRPLERPDVTENGIRITKYIWRSGPELYAYGLLMEPADARADRPLTLAVWDEGTLAIRTHAAWLETQWNAGRAVFVLDPAGVGQNTPHSCTRGDDLFRRYGTMYKYACDLILLGDSFPAMRTYDVLRAAAVCDALGSSRFSVYASGRAALHVRLAALLDARFQNAEYADCIESYRAFLKEEPYDDRDIYAQVLPGMLRITPIE